MDQDLYDAFCREYAALPHAVSEASHVSGAGREEIACIVDTYHRIIGISSMIRALEPCTGDSMRRLDDARATVAEFDAHVHPGILRMLAESVKTQTEHLMCTRDGSEPGVQSGLYDMLRQTISTREFVMQYDAGLGQ